MPYSFTMMGATLGVLARYGMENMQHAVAALKNGTATPEQQKMAFALLDALTTR